MGVFNMIDIKDLVSDVVIDEKHQMTMVEMDRAIEANLQGQSLYDIMYYCYHLGYSKGVLKVNED